MRGFVGICGNAFETRDVHESFISRLVCSFSSGVNRVHLFSGMEKTLVSAGYVVVHLDSENAALLGFRNDGGNAIAIQTVAGDSHIIWPIVRSLRVLGTRCRTG